MPRRRADQEAEHPMNRFGDEELKAVKRVLDSGLLSGFFKNMRGGPEVQSFEEALAKYVGVKYALSCSNGTAALHLALMAAGVKRGMKVACPPLTFSATASSILMVGAEPVFVDVEQDTYNIDPERLARVCEVERIDAVIPVSLLGVPVRMDLVTNLSDKYDMIVIEDAAQALGASYRGRKIGAWGHLATLSGQDTKTCSYGGEGGAVLTDSDEYAERIIRLRNHGQQYPYPSPGGTEANFVCFNYRLSELHAAVAQVQLSKLDGWNKMQRENRVILRELLEPEGYVFQGAPPDSYATHYIYGSTTARRDRLEVLQRMKDKGWSQPVPGSTVGPGYTRTIMDLPLLKPYRRFCPVAEWLVSHYTWWDLGRWLTPEEFKPRADEMLRIVKG